ncbi:Fe-S protein assembly co-chaperone HscB [Phytophthora nicotianae]|uniref:Fe-S protein assembly co-chaperone HscB n=1 Tax=Phytophthora nicotianae TaxID=4792 RepID=W2L6Y8_PHYNI|nr:Fe-S protein assembly co-chaperone HscB [Phytophthora nicotianae]
MLTSKLYNHTQTELHSLLSMLSGKVLCRGLQRALRAPQQMRSLAVAVEKVDDDIPEASCRPEAKGPDCWKCHHATDCCSFFCKSCNAIQPIDKGCHCDYFEMFKVPKDFNLEQRSIEKTYWNLQKRLHPDLYGSKSEFEKELSAVNAAVINDAYKMLKTPNTRVKYLLALHGIDALGETASTAVDPELLMQTMEIRERIAEAPDVNALHEIRKEISEHIDSIINKLGEVYDKDQDLESTKQYAVELQYMVKCAEEIDLREEKLDEY